MAARVERSGGEIPTFAPPPPPRECACLRRKENKRKELAEGKDRKRLPEARFGVLISGSKERGTARREKTSAVMTTAVPDSGHGHIKTENKGRTAG